MRQPVDERQSLEVLFRELIEAAPDAILISDVEGTITLVNAQAEQLFGYSREELIGQTIELLVPQRLHETHAAHRAGYIRQPRARLMGADLDLMARRKDGSEVPVDISLSPIRTAGGTLIFCDIRDVTLRKAIERQISHLNESLARRAVDLESVNKELEAFSYSVSHDLRAPLRALDGFSQALLEDYSASLDAEGQDYLRRVRAAAQHMGHLIDDLLKLSRVTRAGIERVEVDLTALAQGIAEELQRSEPQRTAEFVIAPALRAQADAQLVRIVLENLLSNAWKFTRPRPLTRIELGQRPFNGRPAYYVQDNGVGFDMHYANKLFMAFQRLHDAREFPGTGVGLATVQRVIRKHGGQVWAQSEEGKGTTFCFTL